MKETVPVVTEGQLEIAEFKGKEIRKVLHDDEWYFSVVDVVEAVMETASPSRYWNELKARLVKVKDTMNFSIKSKSFVGST